MAVTIPTFKPSVNLAGYDITKYVESPIVISERLDEVLDSATFTIVYVYKKRNATSGSIEIAPIPDDPLNDILSKTIEPFTICSITKIDGSTSYYYASSTCQKVISDRARERYIHSVTLYELTKRLETFILGSKAFSHIEGMSDYNSDYNRIRIITELMNDKYDINITLDSTIESRFTKEREYSFGAGTTMFDALKEIMANENCIPRLKTSDGESLVLTYDDIDAITDTLVELDNIEAIESTQSVDEYCSEIETEMSDVTGTYAPSSVTLTARSVDEVMSTDNACLILPTKIDSIYKLELVGDAILIANTEYYFTISVDLSIDQQNEINTLSRDTLTYSNAYSSLKTYISEKVANEFMEKCEEYNISKTAGIIISARNYDTIYIGGRFANLDSNDNDNAENIEWKKDKSYSVEITDYLLTKEQWDLLELTEQPKYLYYEHGTNIIAGFNNVYNDTFWMSIIYGKVSSFMAGVFVDKNGVFAKTIDGTGYDNASAVPQQFRVTYFPMVSFFTRLEKTTKPSSTTARSYNNGGSSVDFSQLMPEMKKNVNQLGLEIITIQSFTDVPVGTNTKYGYVINKTITYRITQDGIIDSIVYNCSSNKQLVAESVQRATQYEATNLPQTGIVDRFVELKWSVPDTLDYDNLLLLISGKNITDLDVSAKPLVTMSNFVTTSNGESISSGYVDNLYFVCEADDNYSIGNKRTEGVTKGYFMNTPVPYSDSNNYLKTYGFRVLSVDASKDAITRDFYNTLPTIPKTSAGSYDFTLYGTSYFISNKLVYKDPRERLIFVIKAIKNEN